MSDAPNSQSRASLTTVLRRYPDQARTRITETDWRLTLYLTFAVVLVYFVQTLAAVRLGTSVEGVTSYLFLEYPVVAWPLSMFLHNGNAHFLANVVFLIVTGIEAQRHLSNGQYLALFLVSAVVTPALGAAANIPFTDKPVGVWGISGFVFALATYLLVHLYVAHDEPFLTEEGFNIRRNPFEVAGILLGVSVVLLVSFDVGQALLNGGRGVNGGHLGGSVIGSLFGYIMYWAKHDQRS